MPFPAASRAFTRLFVAALVSLLAAACAPAQTATPSPEPALKTAAPAPEATATPLPSPTPAKPAFKSDLNFAQVIFVRASQGSNGLWKFDVTVRHNDEGWDHYANAWQVVGPAGNILAERILAHPHDTEQPFTRSQSSINIPPNITGVIVRAKCNVHGFGGQQVRVNLATGKGENFEVIRP